MIACRPWTHWGVRHLVLTHVIQIGDAQGAALAHEREYVEWLDTWAQPLRGAGLAAAEKAVPELAPRARQVECVHVPTRLPVMRPVRMRR